MASVDDDRFRDPGTQYEHEEPVAFAAIKREASIDWSDRAHSPDDTLWIPESLFQELAARTRLGEISVHEQARLDRRECQALCEELTTLEAGATDADVRLAATLVLERARTVAQLPDGYVLLIEGP